MRACSQEVGSERPLDPPDGCACCPHRADSLWGVLARDEMALLVAGREQRQFTPGEALITQGQPCRGIHCIEQGEVAVRRADGAGNSFVLRLRGPESTVGYRAFFSGRPHLASVEALTDCRTCFIPAELLRDLLRRSEALVSEFLATAARELEEADECRIRQAFLPVRARLAHLLLCLRERHGRVEPDGTLVITLPLSRQDMASQIGTAPETIARSIRSLGANGIAHFDGRSVRVPDLDLLLDEVEQAGLH